MSLTTFSGPVQSLNGFIGAFTGTSATFSGNVAITGNETVGGTLGVTGNETVGGTLAVTGALTSATAKSDYQKFLGTKAVVLFGTGTWTITRLAEANYVARHTPAADTSILGIDITEAIRTTALKGFSLASIDVIYTIGTLALNAHTATLDIISFTHAAAATITSVPITGTLGTATTTNISVVNLPVTTPAFDNLADSKYVFELTVNAAATSTYDYYGIVLHFSRNDL